MLCLADTRELAGPRVTGSRVDRRRKKRGGTDGCAAGCWRRRRRKRAEWHANNTEKKGRATAGDWMVCAVVVVVVLVMGRKSSSSSRPFCWQRQALMRMAARASFGEDRPAQLSWMPLVGGGCRWSSRCERQQRGGGRSSRQQRWQGE